MGIRQGSTVWGVRVTSQPEHWTSYTVGKQIGKGASAFVYQLDANTYPRLAAKIYEDEALDELRGNDSFRQRIGALAIEREKLGRELPFAFWPRRLLFTQRAPRDHDVPRALVGYTMAELSATVPLATLLRDEAARLRLTHADNIHIAATLAGQIAKLHAHPWRFVFGDLSPNNVHVTHDFARVYFIDTDAFQFQYNNPRYAYRAYGTTPGYNSPGSRQIVRAKGFLSSAHDDFVLATLIFQILMAQALPGLTHPCGYRDTEEDDNIDQRVFPYAYPGRYPVPKEPLAFYNGLPGDIRASFVQTFTSARPFPSSQWPALLSRYRRGLQCP